MISCTYLQPEKVVDTLVAERETEDTVCVDRWYYAGILVKQTENDQRRPESDVIQADPME